MELSRALTVDQIEFSKRLTGPDFHRKNEFLDDDTRDESEICPDGPEVKRTQFNSVQFIQISF